MPRMMAPGVLIRCKSRKVEKVQDGVDDPVFFQQILPCKCPKQEIHPHRKNKDQNDETGLVYILSQKGSWPADRQGSGRSAVLTKDRSKGQSTELLSSQVW